MNGSPVDPVQQITEVSQAPGNVHGIRGPMSKKHRLIPQSAITLMEQQDAQRAAIRAHLDEIGARETVDYIDPVTDETFQLPTGKATDYFCSGIGDFPSPERIAQLPDLDDRDRAYENAIRAAADRKKLNELKTLRERIRRVLHLLRKVFGR